MKWEVVLGMLLLLPGALAIDQVITNSEDWQDVYSGMLFASLSDVKGNFIVNQQDGLEKTQLTDTAFPEILLVESEGKPIIAGYATSLVQRGLIVEKVTSRQLDANLALARRLGVTKFILIDDAQGYNAVSVAPYAVHSGRYVLFINNDNYERVVDFLEDTASPDVLVYGIIGRVAQAALEDFSTDTINEQDRFLNNVEVAKRFVDEAEFTQATFSSGEFLEPSLFNGEFPTLFLGKETTPASVKEFIRDSPIKSGVLVGNGLVSEMRQIRDELNLSIFIRFSQGRFNQIRELDLFPVPSVQLELSVTNIYYDSETNKLVVTYKNLGRNFLYFRSSIGLFVEEELLRRIGDEKPHFLEGGEIKTISYDLGDMEAVTETLTAKVTTLFGDSPLSQEYILEHTASVEALAFKDDSEIRAVSVVYDENVQSFFVEMENIGPVGTYVSVELQDVNVGGSLLTFAVSGSVFMQPGEIRQVKIPATLHSSDYARNEFVTVSARYGKEKELQIFELSEDVLLQVIEKENLIVYIYGLGGAVAILLLLVILLAFRGREKKKK